MTPDDEIAFLLDHIAKLEAEIAAFKGLAPSAPKAPEGWTGEVGNAGQPIAVTTVDAVASIHRHWPPAPRKRFRKPEAD